MDKLFNMIPTTKVEKLIWERHANKLLVEELKKTESELQEVIRICKERELNYNTFIVTKLKNEIKELNLKYIAERKKNTKLIEENLELALFKLKHE